MLSSSAYIVISMQKPLKINSESVNFLINLHSNVQAIPREVFTHLMNGCEWLQAMLNMSRLSVCKPISNVNFANFQIFLSVWDILWVTSYLYLNF